MGRQRVTCNGRGLLLEGMVTLDGVEGALRIGGWSIRSPFCDLEAGWERGAAGGREGASVVLEGFKPWGGGEKGGEAAGALGRACGLGKAACELCRGLVRAVCVCFSFSLVF